MECISRFLRRKSSMSKVYCHDCEEFVQPTEIPGKKYVVVVCSCGRDLYTRQKIVEEKCKTDSMVTITAPKIIWILLAFFCIVGVL